MAKYLIINADDFGYNKTFNEVILDLIRKDYLLSTTVMVNWISKDQDKQINKLIELSRKKNISVGLHLEFLNENYILQINEQYNRFKRIFGFKPSHLDIHKTHQEAYSLVAEFSKKLNLPYRNHGNNFNHKLTTGEKYFSGTSNDLKKVEEWLKTLKEGNFYEILFHPGKYDPNCASSLNKEREKDAEKIIKLKPLLKKYKIQLASYKDLSLLSSPTNL